jgi:hypothetical protein
MNRTLALVLILLLVPCVHAENGSGAAKPLLAQTLSSFNQESDHIRKQMQPGGIYEHISLADKTRVEARLNDMQKLLQANAASSNLLETDKVALVNAQEEVNGILQHNDNNRLVCEHVAPVGSHRPVTTCQTYGEKMAREERDQKYLLDRNRTPQTKSGG